MTEEKQCGKCRELQPLTAFAPSQRAKASSWCKTCRTVYYRERNGSSERIPLPVVPGQVHCGRCQQFKPLDAFNKSQTRNGAWCKACLRQHYVETAPPPPPGFGTCSYCGKAIDNPGTTQRRYCDGACKAAALYWRRNPRTERTCDDCGADITAMRRDARFCNDACATHWRNANTTPAQRRARKLKDSYGITPQEYDAMVVLQGNRCAICGGSESGDPRYEFWHVDHDHATGKVRGLLCQHCNLGLGLFRDSVEYLTSAIEYLSR